MVFTEIIDGELHGVIAQGLDLGSEGSPPADMSLMVPGYWVPPAFTSTALSMATRRQRLFSSPLFDIRPSYA